MNFVSKIKENPLLIFQVILIVLIILLAIMFVVVMNSENPEWIFKLLGIDKNEEPKKYEVLKFLGIGMGGILVALQALASHRRAKAMEDTAKAQVKATEEQARVNENTEQGLRQERLKNAIEHLGNEKDSVRLGGAYELFHLVEDNEDLRKTAFDILCAHIRQMTGTNEYRKAHKSKPSEEVQSLLTLLFVQNHEVFKGLQINLQGCWLNGADLQGAHLQDANLIEAHLQGAFFRRALLQRAFLLGAQMQGVKLGRAQMQGTNLLGTYLQGANLRGADAQGADLDRAHLQGTDLFGTRLQGANLRGVRLQGVGSEFWSFTEFFEARIRNQIGKETDLSGAIFAGGLTEEDVDSLVEGLSEEKANELREKLEPHVDRDPSNELPEDSDAITGAYTKEEAEQWIAEYEKAMSEVPEDDN